jgi:hypothetical protein
MKAAWLYDGVTTLMKIAAVSMSGASGAGLTLSSHYRSELEVHLPHFLPGVLLFDLAEAGPLEAPSSLMISQVAGCSSRHRMAAGPAT